MRERKCYWLPAHVEIHLVECDSIISLAWPLWSLICIMLASGLNHLETHVSRGCYWSRGSKSLPLSYKDVWLLAQVWQPMVTSSDVIWIQQPCKYSYMFLWGTIFIFMSMSVCMHVLGMVELCLFGRCGSYTFPPLIGSSQAGNQRACWTF